MKQTLLILFSLLSFNIGAKATNFSLVIATVDTDYAHYTLTTAVVDTDLVRITGLGNRPVNPNSDSTASQWTTFLSLANTYDSSNVALQDSLVIHLASQRANEITVLTDLGYGTPLLNPPTAQWIKVSGNNFTTAWIGYGYAAQKLYVTFTRPARQFPNY